MHYIHTVRTYIFTYIYLSRYLHLSVCLSIPKVQYLIFFPFFSFYTKFRSTYLVFSPSFFFSSFPGRVGR